MEGAINWEKSREKWCHKTVRPSQEIPGYDLNIYQSPIIHVYTDTGKNVYIKLSNWLIHFVTRIKRTTIPIK